MAIKQALLIVITLWSLPTSASEFEYDGWPGEGIPAFSTRNSMLRLHKSPALRSESITVTVGAGDVIRNVDLAKSNINYDKSKVITKRSVVLTATATVTNTLCQGRPATAISPVISPGETIEYLQYRAEGYVLARYKGMICEIYVADKEPKFDGLDKQPKVEWWVRLVDSENKILGWLLVNEEQINYLPRNF